MIEAIQRFGQRQRFDGLSMVNLKPSKPSYPKVIKPYIPNLYMGHMGYRGYIDTMVCRVSSLFPALLAGNMGGHNKPSYIKPSYGQYAGYAGHKDVMV
jgi:hypothetical protein